MPFIALKPSPNGEGFFYSPSASNVNNYKQSSPAGVSIPITLAIIQLNTFMKMKTQSTILALCLLGAGIAVGQTTSTTSSTVVTTNYTTDSASTATGTQINGTTNNAAPQSSYSTSNTTSTDTDRMSSSGKRSDGKGGKFGIYAGVNGSQFVKEQLPDNSFRPGYQIGVYYRSPGTIFGQIGAEYRAASANLIRTGAGSGTTTGTVANELKGSIDQRFLAIPAYIGVRAGGALGFRVQVGAELAALVAVGQNNFQLGKDDLNRTILNGLAGVGINLGPITLDAVYNHGFQAVFDNGADTKRNILALNVGLRF